MNGPVADLPTLRKRVTRLKKRVLAEPRRGAFLVEGEVSRILGDLKRLAPSEPALVLDGLVLLLDEVGQTLGFIEDDAGLASDVVPEILIRIEELFERHTRPGEEEIDPGRAVTQLFGLWIDDEHGYLSDLSDGLFRLTTTAGADWTLRSALLKRIRSLPLVFPPPGGASDDVRRALLLAERHRCERLLGELLARGGYPDYAVVVAAGHARVTGDAFDYVSALHRAGRTDEAITVARTSLASPTVFQAKRLQRLLDDMVEFAAHDGGRQTRKKLERQFIFDPSLQTFVALRRVVPKDQWQAVRGRLLDHLRKHQKAPSILFKLYLEEGDLLEADALAVVQPIDPDILLEEATKLVEQQPAIAAGWVMLAANHRAAFGKKASPSRIVKDLLMVRDLAALTDQREAFAELLARFQVRYRHIPGLDKALSRSGLTS